MRLYMITPTLWAYDRDGNIFRSSRAKIIRACLDMGYSEAELEFGIREALSKDHNHCDFGEFNKSFLFSKFDEDVSFMLPGKGVA